MKPLALPLLAAASLAAFTSAASAAVLFTDNFDVTTGSFTPPNNTGQGPNFELSNPGRVGGTLAPLNYTFGGNVQVGNTTTFVANSGAGSALGDDMLITNASYATIGYNFSAVAGPLTINFDANPYTGGADLTNWFSFMVYEGTGTVFVNNPNIDFGILFRANGATQHFTDGGSGVLGGVGPSVGSNTWASYKVVLSDAAGTGSAFGSGSSKG